MTREVPTGAVVGPSGRTSARAAVGAAKDVMQPAWPHPLLSAESRVPATSRGTARGRPATVETRAEYVTSAPMFTRSLHDAVQNVRDAGVDERCERVPTGTQMPIRSRDREEIREQQQNVTKATADCA